jgi:hypothetical protein
MKLYPTVGAIRRMSAAFFAMGGSYTFLDNSKLPCETYSIPTSREYFRQMQYVSISQTPLKKRVKFSSCERSSHMPRGLSSGSAMSKKRTLGSQVVTKP